MKKIKLVLEIFRLVWRFLKTFHLRHCLLEMKNLRGKTTYKLFRDRRIGIVFVFGPKEMTGIRRTFPKARVEFQCATSVPAAPHRMIRETAAYKRKERIVFINPWKAEDVKYQGLFDFDPMQLLFLLDSMVNDWKQKILIASCKNGMIEPSGSYHRELMEPHMIVFRIKERIKELFTFKLQRSAGFVPCCSSIVSPPPK